MRTVVVAIEVTPVAGATPGIREEATEDCARFDAEQREQHNQRRQEQRARRRDNKRREAVARAAVEGVQSDEPVAGEAPAAVAPIRHRRQPRIAEVRPAPSWSTWSRSASSSHRTLTASPRVAESNFRSRLVNAHAALDAAVLSAYDWPADLAGEAILERLLTLNLERATTPAARAEIGEE